MSVLKNFINFKIMQYGAFGMENAIKLMFVKVMYPIPKSFLILWDCRLHKVRDSNGYRAEYQGNGSEKMSPCKLLLVKKEVEKSNEKWV